MNFGTLLLVSLVSLTILGSGTDAFQTLRFAASAKSSSSSSWSVSATDATTNTEETKTGSDISSIQAPLAGPREVKSRVFPSSSNGGDQRPVILFDGVCNMCNGAGTFSVFFFKIIIVDAKKGQG